MVGENPGNEVELNFSGCVKQVLYMCNEVICLIEGVSKWRFYLQF